MRTKKILNKLISRLGFRNSSIYNYKKKAKFRVVIDSGNRETEEWRNIDIFDYTDKALDPIPMRCNHENLF